MPQVSPRVIRTCMFQHRLRTVHARHLKTAPPQLRHMMPRPAPDLEQPQTITSLRQVTFQPAVQPLATIGKASAVSVRVHLPVGFSELGSLERVRLYRALLLDFCGNHLLSSEPVALASTVSRTTWANISAHWRIE